CRQPVQVGGEEVSAATFLEVGQHASGVGHLEEDHRQPLAADLLLHVLRQLQLGRVAGDRLEVQQHRVSVLPDDVGIVVLQGGGDQELEDLQLPRVGGGLVVLQQLLLREQRHRLLDYLLHVGNLQQVNGVAGQDNLNTGSEDVDAVLNAGLVPV